MADDGTIQIILNASAGSTANVLHDLTELTEGDPRWQIDVAHSGAQLVKLAESAAQGSAEIVVAAGGDGTISTVASALVGTSKTLGVLPVGTLNHFAKDLGLPLDLAGALQTIRDGQTIKIDVGDVNGRTFINNSSLGLYPRIVKHREKHQRLGSSKWAALLWATLRVWRRFPLLDVKLEAESETIACRTPFVFVGNNRYEMEGLNVGARKRLDAGELSLYLTSRTRAVSIVWLMLRGLFGGLWKEKDFTAMTTKEVRIATRHRKIRVATDGEVTIMQPPLHYRVLPQTLNVIVPAEEA